MSHKVSDLAIRRFDGFRSENTPILWCLDRIALPRVYPATRGDENVRRWRTTLAVYRRSSGRRIGRRIDLRDGDVAALEDPSARGRRARAKDQRIVPQRALTQRNRADSEACRGLTPQRAFPYTSPSSG